MPSKCNSLSAVTQLEQTMAADSTAAFDARGVTVVHNGTAVTNAPGGRADIELRDAPNGTLTLVEATKRRGSAADGEFIAIWDHLDAAVAAGGYADFGCLSVSPDTSARMSATLQERNRGRERDGRRGRIIAVPG